MLFGIVLCRSPDAVAAHSLPGLKLEVSPQVCTLAADDSQCDTEVRVTWSAPKDESLCLVILGRDDVKRCWDNFSQGTYTIGLTFNEDLTFQLRDPELHEVLATATLRVIREALHYRHKRRQPWNLFD